MTDQQKVKLLPCPFCGSLDGYIERYDYSSCYWLCNDCMARGPLKVIEDEDEEIPGHDPALIAWNTRQAALAHASSASAEECSVDTKRLDALQSIVQSGQRVEFAKSLAGNGVEIGVRSPCRAVVADNLREAIDQAIAGRQGEGHG